VKSFSCQCCDQKRRAKKGYFAKRESGETNEDNGVPLQKLGGVCVCVCVCVCIFWEEAKENLTLNGLNIK